jgi:RNase P subunit RPR2
VTYPKQTTCRKCGQPMQAVANVAPRSGEPGLIAYQCPACGAGHSDLVYPEHGREDHGGEGRGVSDNAKR